MKESMQTPEERSEGEQLAAEAPSPEKKDGGKYSFFLNAFDSFLNLSDDPGRHITDQEKLAALKSGDKGAVTQLGKEKKGSKYRKNAFIFLSYALTLLEEEGFAKAVGSEKIERLGAEIRSLQEKINELRIKDEKITKQEIDRGTAIINELKDLINKAK